MSFSYKDKDQLVQDVLDRLIENMNFEIDLDVGEPIRTIIEALMQEMDLQYWQLEQVYNGSFIESSYGDDLTELVKILGTERKPASYSTGKVKFYRETTSSINYYIPSGTSIKTLPDYNGNTYLFETTSDATLVQNTLEVEVPIRALEPGKDSNVIDNSILIINDPPLGIESVINNEPTTGGENEETDEELKDRAKNLLDTKGLGTVNALKNKIANIDGIREVSVLDFERGIGTSDVLVLGDTLPLTTAKKEEIEIVIQETKPAGIDVILQEPNLISTDVTVQLFLEVGSFVSDYISEVTDAINNYVNNLTIGEKLYKNQLERYILNVSDNILDVNVSIPAGNITPNPKEIIRIGNIEIS
jgi:uncharacterized phage protein gp47/JayE